MNPLSPHPLLYTGLPPDEAEIRAGIKSIQDNQQQEVLTKIFQQARSNISRSPLIPTPRTYPTAEPNRNAISSIERHLSSKYSHHVKDGSGHPVVDHTKPPPEPAPTYIPKDLSELIIDGAKKDVAYSIYEAVRGCQTKVKNASAREKEFVVGGGGYGEGTKMEEGDGRMLAPVVGLRREMEGLQEEQKRVQRNTLDVARDPRLQRR